MSDADGFCKSLHTVRNHVEEFLDYYGRLAANHLAPEIIGTTEDVLRIRKCQTLRQWVDARPAPEEVQAMGIKVVELLEHVHELGFCHRDAHIRNFVVHAGSPLIVDPKHATNSERNKPCYDVYGPDRSEVAIAPAHTNQTNRNRLGVWWENADPLSEALASTFGTVAELHQV